MRCQRRKNAHSHPSPPFRVRRLEMAEVDVGCGRGADAGGVYSIRRSCAVPDFQACALVSLQHSNTSVPYNLVSGMVVYLAIGTPQGNGAMGI